MHAYVCEGFWDAVISRIGHVQRHQHGRPKASREAKSIFTSETGERKQDDIFICQTLNAQPASQSSLRSREAIDPNRYLSSREAIQPNFYSHSHPSPPPLRKHIQRAPRQNKPALVLRQRMPYRHTELLPAILWLDADLYTPTRTTLL